MAKTIGTNIRVQHLILTTAGQKPTIPSPVNITPEDSRWKRETDILKGEWAYNVEDDIWFYRKQDDTIGGIPISNVGGGESFSLGKWNFETATGTPPSSNSIRLNNSTPASATKLYIHDLDNQSTNYGSKLSGLPSGSIIYIFVDDTTNFQITISAATDQSTYVEFDISDIIVEGTISNGTEVSVSVDVAGGGAVNSVFGRTGAVTAQSGDYNEDQISNKKEYIVVAASDETSDLSAGADKATFRMPFAATITEVRADVNTAPVGSTLIVDINESGTSILSTKITIDDGETTSETAATPPVISDSSIAENAEISIDIDQVGSSTPGSGLRITIIVER